jgi:DNA segregation ATPase FtsK/SpoIIIE-like protein
MRRKILLVALVLLGSLTVFVPSARALSIGVNFFYDDLAPHGHWFQMENYGWVWTPRHVAATWRPYTMGHWAYSDDYGWTWVSNEDFGWATYHYGRWFFDADYGWVWVPGDQWAPAWVSWRSGGGYVGWAPMSPDYDWQRGRYGGGLGLGYAAPTQYVFVSEPNFADPVVYRHIVPWDRDDQVVRVTRDVTRYQTFGDRIVNRAVPVRDVERAAGRAVPRYRVEAVQAGPRRPVVQGNTVRIFRPTRQQIAQAPPPRMAPPSTAVPRVKPRPAAPPAKPTAARVAPPPASAPNRGAPRGAEVQNQRQQEKARQEQAQQQRQQQGARQQEAARQKETQQQKQQAQAERQRQQEQARQRQAARQKEGQQQKQQAQAERQRQQEQARQQQQEQRAQALREQQAARQRAQQQREQQKREEQAKKKPKPPEPPPPDKGGE